MKSDVGIMYKKGAEYPLKETLFRPCCNYPEYPFKNEVCDKNDIYEMIREVFYLLKMDEEHYGQKDWNPLGSYIMPENTVLLKPNMVMHQNLTGEGTECLYTQPSVVAAIVDYVVIALKGTGKIIVGDAPMQECDFEQLIDKSGYRELIKYYQNKGIDISLLDFRNVKTFCKDGVHYEQEQGEKNSNGIIVKVDDVSSFHELDGDRIQKLRITNYDPDLLQAHHSNGCHEYKVTQEVLNADVIINIPKPKTHRKAGITASLKNLVGICTNKEYLPHHSLGSKEEGGDAYLNKNSILFFSNKLLDVKNRLNYKGNYQMASIVGKWYDKVMLQGKNKTKEQYWEGSWYGNDTIWRTIFDLNKILFYTDHNGKLTKEKQRKMLIIGDMVISGHKEGPLEPTAISPGVIICGENPLSFDRTVCSLMGFDYRKIPTISSDNIMRDSRLSELEDTIHVISNNSEWNEKSIDDICNNSAIGFIPTAGWLEKLGCKKYDKWIDEIKEAGGKVYIWGAGFNGIELVKNLKKSKIEIFGIFDNDKNKVGKKFENVKCLELKKINNDYPCIIAVNKKYVLEIKEQLQKTGINKIYVSSEYI